MAGAALGLGFAVLTPQQALAQCVVGANSVVCNDTTTTNTTNAGGTPAFDRNYLVNTSAAPFTGTVNAGEIVQGYGLAFTNTVSGPNALNVVNGGVIQVDVGLTPTAGGTAALNVTATGATPVVYSGAGDVFNFGTAGDGINITSTGTGGVTANVGGSVTSAVGGSGVNVLNSGTGGALSVTTTAGETIRAGLVGVYVRNTNPANTGTVTVNNNATVASLTGAPNTLQAGVYAETAGTGNLVVNNTGTIGSTTDRAQFVAVAGVNSGTAGNVTVTNGAGSVFGNIGILGQSTSTGTLAVTTGAGQVNAVNTGILVNAGGTNVTTVTTGSGAVTASAPTGVGIDVQGLANTAATTVTTGGTVTGGAVGIRVATIGTQAITANGTTNGATAGIHSDTTAARTITVGAAGNVTGTTQAILLTKTGTATVTNGGIVGAASTGLAINAAAAGATTVTNQSAGTLNGRVTLSGGNDTMTNAGLFNTQGISDFGAGTDSLNNTASGTINLTGATTFANLETFTNTGRINLNTFVLTGSPIAFTNGGTVDTNGNAGIAGFTSFNNAGTLDLAAGTFTVPVAVFTNSGTILADEGAATITGQTSFSNTGTIDLQDGVVDDILTINSNFVGSGGSALLVDFNSTASDELVINGAASGTTTIGANFLGGGLINLDGVLVVDAITATDNAFILGAVGGDTPLVDFSLVQEGGDFFLVSAPSAAAFNPLVVPGFATDLWYQSANEVFAETVKPATTVGVSFWGNGYYSRDRYGDKDGTVVVDGVSFDVNNRAKTKRYGVQMGVDYGFPGARVGLTGGYAWAKADGSNDADLKAKGWNVGLYGQFGGITGFHGEFLAKHDRYDAGFDNGVFDGEDFDIRSTGFDGSLGFRFGMGADGNVDVHGGLSHVRTKVDDIDAFGFNYDLGKTTSTRGRAGVRATFGGAYAPYVAATAYHEFKGDGDIGLFDGANTFDLDTRGKGTWARIEAGLSGNDGPGPILAAWGDFGDRKGLGLRAGWRIGGARVIDAAPPPPPPPPAPVVEAPATQTCGDGSVILATDSCPLPPPPPPPPAPEPERG